MLRRALPVALVLAAAAADGGGQHLLAFYLLVVAVPAAAAAALTALGQLVELPAGARLAAPRAQALLGALGLTAIVVAAAARANAVDGASVPTLGVSAVVACLTAFALQAFVALLAPVRTSRVRGQTPAAQRPVREADRWRGPGEPGRFPQLEAHRPLEGEQVA